MTRPTPLLLGLTLAALAASGCDRGDPVVSGARQALSDEAETSGAPSAPLGDAAAASGSSEARLGFAGGVVESPDGRLAVHVAPRALRRELRLRVGRAGDDAPPDDLGLSLLGPIYEVEVLEGRLPRQVGFDFSLEPLEEVPEAEAPEDGVLVVHDGRRWRELETQPDVEACHADVDFVRLRGIRRDTFHVALATRAPVSRLCERRARRASARFSRECPDADASWLTAELARRCDEVAPPNARLRALRPCLEALACEPEMDELLTFGACVEEAWR